MCRKEITDQGRTPPSAGGSPLDRYEGCFAMAFEQADDRRAFLHQHLHTARISAANLRLAHLLSEGTITKLVFTPNFDEMLTRALRLFGHEVIVCDHPKTTQRIDPGRPDLQIVHVHGTHWFYDCCNLRGEIEGQARHDLTDSVSMGQLLERVLAERSPLVVGYSGWEGDVLMTAVRRRLQQPTLPFNLYWFCYQRAVAESLPAWLRNHASVRLVLPSKAAVATGGEPAERPRRGGVEALRGERGSAGGLARERTLRARDVFEAFIQKLDLKAPHLTAEPLEFFLQYLVNNLDPEDASGHLYLIGEVLDRVRVGMELEKSRRLGDSAAQRKATEALRQVSDAVRRSAYPIAARAAKEIEVAALAEDQRKELDEALRTTYLALADLAGDLGLGVCKIWNRLAESALASGSPDRNAWSASAARALGGKGYCLYRLGRPEAAIEAWSQVVQRFGDDPAPALRVEVAKALFNLGTVQFDAGKPEPALAAWSQVVRRFGDAPEPALREQVASALVNQGAALGEVGKPQTAVYAQVVRRFGDAPEPALRHLVAMALLNRGIALSEEGKHKAALHAWSEVLKRFGDSPEPALREDVANALFNQGVALGQAGKVDAEVESYSQVVQRFGDAPEPALRELVAAALVNQGIVLGATKQPEAAAAAYSQVIQRFGKDPEPALRDLVATATRSLAKTKGRAERKNARGRRPG